MSEIWYYAQDDKPIGPLSLIELRKVLSLTSEARNVCVWRSDFADWKKAESVEELAAAVVRPPPIRPANETPPPITLRQAAAPSAPTEEAGQQPKTPERFFVVDPTRDPAQRVRRADWATKIIAGLTVVFLGCMAWRVYLFQEMLDLVRKYGYGHVPQALSPYWLSESDTIIWVASWCWSIGIITCVMVCFYQIYCVLQTRFGQHFKWSISWTVMTLLIPLVGLVRPWLGFGEIRRKMIATRYGGASTFDFFTLAFALTYIFGVTTMKTIGTEEERLVNATSIDQSHITSALGFESAYAGLALVVGLISFFYCRSVVVGVREAMAGMKGVPIAAAAPASGAYQTSTEPTAGTKFDPNNPISDPFANLPEGSTVERHFTLRVAFLPDGTVFGETHTEPSHFKTFEEWRRAIFW